MFKNTIIILSLLGILLQTFGKAYLFVDYYINKEYIAKTFCENKDKPKMKCEGKCHLKKELKEEDKKEQTPQTNLKEKYELQLFSQSKLVFDFSNPYKIVEHHSLYTSTKSSAHLIAVFRPPQV